MAAPTMRCCLSRVLAQSPTHLFSRMDCHSSMLPCFGNLLLSNRYYATKSRERPKRRRLESEPKKRRVYTFPLPSEPKDDVYLTWCYKRPVYEAEVALDMLRKFQQLEFASPNQLVYANLTLDMEMDKKTVEPFVGTVLFPNIFTDSVHKVILFTDKAEDAALAKECGAAFAGGKELITLILNGEIKADYYAAVPGMLKILKPLRNALGTKFPKSKSGSVGYDIAQMVKFFRLCHEYVVLDDNLIKTPVATLDMPNDQIVANLDALIKDVCKYKPLSYGPFVTSLILQNLPSEGLQVKVEPFLPKGAVKGKKKQEVEEEANEEGSDSEEEEIEISR